MIPCLCSKHYGLKNSALGLFGGSSLVLGTPTENEWMLPLAQFSIPKWVGLEAWWRPLSI